MRQHTILNLTEILLCLSQEKENDTHLPILARVIRDSGKIPSRKIGEEGLKKDLCHYFGKSEFPSRF